MLLTQFSMMTGEKLPGSRPLKYESHTDEMTSATRLWAKTSPFWPSALAFSARSALKSSARALTLSLTTRTRSSARRRSSCCRSLVTDACVPGSRIMSPKRKAISSTLFGALCRDPILLRSSSGRLVAPNWGRPVELIFFASPAPAVGEGVSWTLGHWSSSALPPSSTLVPSFVPSLVSENLAQLGSMTCCSWCT